MNAKENCCFSKLLKVIDILQKNSCGELCSDESCTRPFLGGSPTIICYNTRPVTFYTRNGNIFTASYQVGGETRTSSVFRVERVDGCCVKCRILEANPDQSDPTRSYLATNQFITINLDCICVISCLADIIIDSL
ncbi:MAG: CotY/CotZ family spore coat protein [bacterium]|nr:CotY/CotZ family spore coat protein [bacterium]